MYNFYCRFIIMLYLVVLAVCLSTCLANELQPYNETAIGMFHGSDFNGDNTLSRLEIDLTFELYDTNPKDNITSRHEYVTFINRTTPNLVRLSHFLYDIYDVDRDNILEKHDYDNLFDILDFDEDGTINEHEFVHVWTVLLRALGHLIDVGGTDDDIITV